MKASLNPTQLLLSRLRSERDLSYGEIARALPVERRVLAKWVAGTSEPIEAVRTLLALMLESGEIRKQMGVEG